MSHKLQLSRQRDNTIINGISKRQESVLMSAVNHVVQTLQEEFPKLSFHQVPQWHLTKVIEGLKHSFPDITFVDCFKSSSMRPDGGIVSIRSKDDALFPILISEKKNQGTNDLRAMQGKSRQAKGNAIERLGKNVIGFRAALLKEAIFPFVCFGDGCDFADDSSIVDRVKTIAMFGTLNEIHLYNEGPNGMFNRGTYYFRVKEWTESEMYSRSLDVARRSIMYYVSRYGIQRFQ